METTLTGHSEWRVMADARAAGYKITLVNVGLADALASLARVRERVARGGHDIPAAIIMRRYAKSLANLPAADDFADRISILNNTGAHQRLLVTLDQGEVIPTSLELDRCQTSLARTCGRGKGPAAERWEG
jgi:predicted ABC-type ATPase